MNSSQPISQTTTQTLKLIDGLFEKYFFFFSKYFTGHSIVMCDKKVLCVCMRNQAYFVSVLCYKTMIDF